MVCLGVTIRLGTSCSSWVREFMSFINYGHNCISILFKSIASSYSFSSSGIFVRHISTFILSFMSLNLSFVFPFLHLSCIISVKVFLFCSCIITLAILLFYLTIEWRISVNVFFTFMNSLWSFLKSTWSGIVVFFLIFKNV